MRNFSVYSLVDTQTVISHPSVGRKVLSDEENGGGQISIQFTGDMANHNQTANGYVVISKVRSRAGQVTLEVPQNSPSDLFLDNLCGYLASAPTKEFALSKLNVIDTASGKQWTCTGVTPQKRPDRTYAAQAGTLNYTFLCADIKVD